jgi:hypothetical protein
VTLHGPMAQAASLGLWAMRLLSAVHSSNKSTQVDK